MFFDGNEIYMSMSCMPTFVNDKYVTIVPEHCNIDNIESMLESGFSFCNEVLEDVPEAQNYDWGINRQTLVVKYPKASIYKGYNSDGYISFSMYVHDFTY